MAINLINSLYNSLSGLQTTQTLLDTTSRNITNAHTANYVKEVQHSQVAPNGAGVEASKIQRTVDESLLSRQRLTTSQKSYQETRARTLDQISGLSGAPSDNSSLALLVTNLATSFAALSSNPSDPGTSIGVLNTAKQLSDALNSQTLAVTKLQTQAQQSMQDDLATVNSQLQIIADLNDRIVAAGSQNIDTSQLKDQRDAVARELSQKIEIRTFYDNSGSLNVFSSNYQTLVGKYANVISYDSTSNSLTTPTASLGNAGGEIGAYQTIYDTDTKQYLQQLDAFARTLTTSLYNLSSPIAATVTNGSNVVTVPNASILRVGQEIKDSNFPAGARIGAIDGATVTIVNGTAPFAPINPATGLIPNLTAAQLAAAGVAANSTGNAATLYISTPMPLFTPDPATVPTIGNPPYYSGGFQVNQQLLTATDYATILKMGTTSVAPSISTLGSNWRANDALAAIGVFNLLTQATPKNNIINFNSAGGTTPVIGTANNFEDAATAISVTAGQNAANSRDTIAQLETLNSQIEQTISAQSGVNMDEEMSRLIVLQNAYGANAQVTSTAQKMLDMLLGIVR